MFVYPARLVIDRAVDAKGVVTVQLVFTGYAVCVRIAYVLERDLAAGPCFCGITFDLEVVVNAVAFVDLVDAVVVSVAYRTTVYRWGRLILIK